jgi:hypothetical protein
MGEALQAFKRKHEKNDSDDDEKPTPPYLRAIQMSNMLPTAPPKDEANPHSIGPPSTFYPAQPGINRTNSLRAKSLGRYTGQPLSMYVSNQQTAEILPLQNPRRPSYSSADETDNEAHTGLLAAENKRFAEDIRSRPLPCPPGRPWYTACP